MKRISVILLIILNAFAFSKEPAGKFFADLDVFVDSAKINGEGLKITSQVFEGVKLGYEKDKPNSFYSGTDALVAKGHGSMNFKFVDENGKFQKELLNSRGLFANVEQRYGYNFFAPSKTSITPFVGLGWYYRSFEISRLSATGNWVYGAGGLKLVQQLSKYFSFGVNAKAMYAFSGIGKVGNDLYKFHSQDFWGYEVSVPLTWRLKKSCHFQIQPYVLKLNINSNDEIYGGRAMLALNF